MLRGSTTRRALLAAGLSFVACAAPQRSPKGPAAPQPLVSAAAPAGPSTPVAATSMVAPPPPCRSLPPIASLPLGNAFSPDEATPMPGLSSGLPADAPAPLVKACRALEAKNRVAARTRPRMKQPGMADPDRAPLRRGVCFGNARGAWILDVGAFRPKKHVGLTAHEASWSLLFVTPAGGTLGTTDGLGTLSISLGEWDGEVSVVGLADFDGDAVPEVLVDAYRYAAIDGGHDTVAAYTLRGGSIERTQTDAPIAGWLDVDGDGRMDRLRAAPAPDRTLRVVDHGLAGGQLSSDDLVAQASWQQLCPTPPRGPLSTPRAVRCAALWGQPADGFVARIDDARLSAQCRPAALRAAQEPVSPILRDACPTAHAAVEAPPDPFGGRACP